MAKKIYDIKPPKIAIKKVERKPVVKKPVVKKTKVPLTIEKESKNIVTQYYAPAQPQTPVQTKTKKEGKSAKKPIFISILIIVLFVAIYLFFKLPKADITIWPKVDTLSLQQTLTADKSITVVDTAKAVIPAQYFQSIKTATQDFPSTGNGSNEGKSQGTITVYNKYDPPKAFNFVAGTHFMSDSGKLFIALQKITIPAAKKVGSKITPGSVSVQIQAVEGGTDYNIAPSNFSVPGLKGTASYFSVSASSAEAMTGGYTGKVKKVTDDDLQEAKNVLTQKATADATADVKGQISADYILLDNAILSNVTDSSTKSKSGAIADTFNYSVTVQASALAFKKSDVDTFVKSYIASQMPTGKTLLDGSTKVDYSSNVIDISGGKATLNLNISLGAYQNIDKNAIGLSLMGENAEQIKQTITNNMGDQVSKTQIKFWPFWVSSAPNNQSAVHVFLKFQ